MDIEAALSAEVIYNVDYVEMKTALNRTLEKAKAAASAVYLAIPYEDRRTDELSAQYYGTVYPHTLPGWLKKLPKTASPTHAAALEAYRALGAYSEICAKFVAAKGRVVKARKPSTEPRKTPARTLDNTGTCACCGQNVKLDRGLIVAHGYTIRWGFQSGSCLGVSFDPIEVSDEGLRVALLVYEHHLAVARLSLEYGALTRRERAELEGRVSGSKSAIAHYTAAIRDWAPRPLPSEKRV
jgi:hypothetical protein